jgi:hypothetical protein
MVFARFARLAFEKEVWFRAVQPFHAVAAAGNGDRLDCPELARDPGAHDLPACRSVPPGSHCRASHSCDRISTDIIVGKTNPDAREREGAMERFLIETPHTDEECLSLLDQILAMGYLHNFDWGCEDGDHTGWAIIEADNRRIVQLNRFTDEDVQKLHASE